MPLSPRAPWIVAVILALALPAAHAQPTSRVPPAPQASTTPLWGTAGLATRMEKPSDVSHFADAKLSVSQAMAAVAQQHSGRIVEIGFAHKGNTGWYGVTLADAQGLHDLRVDPATGDVGPGELADIARTQLDAVGQRDLDGLRSAVVDLPQAVAAVTKASGARVICAGVEQLGGVPQYYVQTVVKQRLAAWVVDPRTGRVSKPG